MITGSIRVDGEPAAALRVLVVSGDASRLLASAVAGPDGSFEVPVDERPVHVLVKLQGPLIGVVERQLDRGDDTALEVDVDSSDDRFHPLTVRLEGDAEPPFVLLSIDPVHLDGVAPGLEAFFHRRDATVVEASFFSEDVRDRELCVVAQRGQYRISGGYVVKARPVVTSPTPDVVVAAATMDGEGRRLPGDAASGFDFSVAGPTRLTLALAPAS